MAFEAPLYLRRSASWKSLAGAMRVMLRVRTSTEDDSLVFNFRELRFGCHVRVLLLSWAGQLVALGGKLCGVE
jgi:hypothetical protein